MWFPVEVYQGQLGTTETVMYAVSTGRQLVVKEFIICNTSLLELTVTLYVRRGGSAMGPARMILSNKVIPSGETIYFPCSLVVNAGGIISGTASAINSITTTVSGEEAVL